MADDLRHWLRPLTAVAAPPRSDRTSRAVVEPELPAAPGLGKDAFLSYASPDKEAAFRLCRLWKSEGSAAGSPHATCLPEPITAKPSSRRSRTTATTLLLLSAHANASIHVTHEVERATSKRKRVIPIRLEDVQPGPSLELHLATAQWVDAWRLSPDQVAAQLALVLRGEAASRRPLLPAATRYPLLRPAAPQDRAQRAAVLRRPRRRLLPRTAARPSRPGRAAGQHPLLEDPHRGDGPRQHLRGGADLRAVGLRQVVAGQGGPVAAAVRAR